MIESVHYLLASGFLLSRLIVGAVLVLAAGVTINAFKR